jgi:hypothetical protein
MKSTSTRVPPPPAPQPRSSTRPAAPQAGRLARRPPRLWQEQHGRQTPCRHAGCPTAHPRRLGGSVARLPGQVVTRRAHAEHLLVADLHGAGFRAPGLADVPDADAGDRNDPRSAGFAVIRRDRRGAVEGLTMRVGVCWAMEDDGAPGHPAYVGLPRLWPRHLHGPRLVVDVGPTNQDLPSTQQSGDDRVDGRLMRR